MKKNSLVKLALMGISVALLTTGCRDVQGEVSSSEMQTFYEQLSPDAQKKFDALDEEHKMRAMDIIHTYCKAASECGGHREQAVEEQYNHQMQMRRNMQK